MAVPAPVLTAGDVEPEVLAVGGFEDELVEVGVVLQKVEPAAGNGHVGMRPVVCPIGVGGSGEVDVGSLSQGVLGGIGTSHPEVELRATVARADDKGPLTHLGGVLELTKARRGSSTSVQRLRRLAMMAAWAGLWRSRVLSMPSLAAVALLSNSASVKCAERRRFVIIIMEYRVSE